jgi:hypothetical protein
MDPMTDADSAATAVARAAPGHVNVLLTCAGRRTLLAESFRLALGGEGLLYAADMSLEAPALRMADASELVPAVLDPGYVDCLLDICRRRKIGLLVPLNDFELPVLAEARERFTEIGTVVMVSSPEVVEICKDKWMTAEFLRLMGLDFPVTYRLLRDWMRGRWCFHWSSSHAADQLLWVLRSSMTLMNLRPLGFWAAVGCGGRCSVTCTRPELN